MEEIRLFQTKEDAANYEKLKAEQAANQSKEPIVMDLTSNAKVLRVMTLQSDGVPMPAFDKDEKALKLDYYDRREQTNMSSPLHGIGAYSMKFSIKDTAALHSAVPPVIIRET